MRAHLQPRASHGELIPRVGELALWNGGAVRIKAVSSSGQFRVVGLGSNVEAWVAIDDLEPYIEERSTARIRAPADAAEESEQSETAWAIALQELAEAGGDLTRAKEKIARQFGVTLRTVDRHYAIYLVNPSPEAQIRGVPGPARGGRRLDPFVEAIIDRVCEEVYLVREHPRVSDFCSAVDAVCRKEGCPTPSRKAIEARLAAKDPMHVLIKRVGRDEAEAKQKPSIAGLHPTRPLQMVQVDHAIVDLIIVSEETRQEIGRPWITLAIDVFTRAIVGWHLSLDSPNQTDVALCLEHACFPKREFLRDLGLSIDYPVYGKPEVVHWDNAKTFQAKAIKIQCRRRGIGTNSRPVKKPHWGAYVERYIGTLMGRVHLLRGTTFSNTTQRRGYDSQKRAVMSMSELKRWVALEIAQRYFNKKHAGINHRRPVDLWSEAFRSKDGTPRLPPVMGDRKGFLLGMLPFKLRTVSREGVQLFAVKYWDPALTPLINSPGKFRIAYRQDNLSRVWLLHGDDHIEVPQLDRSAPAYS